MAEVTVVGAGPAGLIAAWQLAQAGHECVLIERSSVVGGMAGSFEVAGQRVDYGSHRLHPSTPEHLLATIGGLLGNDLQERRRHGRIRLQGRWVRFPLRATDMVRSLPPSFGLRAGADTLTRPFARRTPQNFMDEVSLRLGPTVAGEFYGPMAQKLYGVDPETLDVEQARRRISVSSPLDIARRLVGSGRSSSSRFLYPRTGYGAIVERMADAAAGAGVDIRLDTPVGRIDPEATTLFTPSPAALVDSLDSPVSSDVANAVAKQKTRAMLLAYLALDVDRYTQFDAHYLPGPETVVSRLSEPKNYRDGPDPAGRTVLCAEIPCWAGDDLWHASDEEIGALVGEDLPGIGLPRVDPCEVVVRRLGSVYPVYELATGPDRALVDSWLREIPGVMVLGRQGLGVPDNLHHVLAMGWEAASCVRKDGSIDRSRWNAALDRFATHVVED